MAPEADFHAEPEAAMEVRRFVSETLRGVSNVDDILLTASELAANVIRHAQTEFTVKVSTDDALVRLEVSDGSSIIPAVEDLADSHWGLRMIESIAYRWGIERTDTGKVVWAEFPTEAVDSP